jgi:hypothetical protein
VKRSTDPRCRPTASHRALDSRCYWVTRTGERENSGICTAVWGRAGNLGAFAWLPDVGGVRGWLAARAWDYRCGSNRIRPRAKQNLPFIDRAWSMMCRMGVGKGNVKRIGGHSHLRLNPRYLVGHSKSRGQSKLPWR